MGRTSLTDIRDELIRYGWIYLDGTYKNLDTELELQCPEGHKALLSLKTWRRKKECPVCAANQFKILEEAVSVKKKNSGKRILSIDQSTTMSGWCVFDGEELVGYGKIKMTHGDTMARICGMNDWMISMVSNWKPDIIGLEDIQQQANPQIFKILAWLQGVLLHTAMNLKIDSKVIHTATWRSGCGVKGKTRADMKKAAKDMIKKWYDVSVTEDEADAICIGRYIATVDMKNNCFDGWEI